MFAFSRQSVTPCKFRLQIVRNKIATQIALCSSAFKTRLLKIFKIWQEIFCFTKLGVTPVTNLSMRISENHGMERADCRACVLSGVYSNMSTWHAVMAEYSKISSFNVLMMKL